MPQTKEMSFAEAVNDALDVAMGIDPSVLFFGLGATDPKGIFGTSLGLEENHGSERVFDMPTSENGMTGVAVGAAINGMKPVMCHQRLDFFLLAMDQLVNNAAKWRFMFGGKGSVPLTIRLIVGKGWGQGPTHSQNLQSWFAHVPGLKVVCPTNPVSAKGLLLSSIFDPNPVVFLEHRWLHNSRAEVPVGDFRMPIGEVEVPKFGDEITIVSQSYMTVEALRASHQLQEMGVSAELIDMSSLVPMNWNRIFESVKKTGHLLVLDTAAKSYSVSAEVCSRVMEECWGDLKSAPRRLALPDIPTPTSFELTKDFYVSAKEVAEVVLEMLGKPSGTGDLQALDKPGPHDVPGTWFTGPF